MAVEHVGDWNNAEENVKGTLKNRIDVVMPVKVPLAKKEKHLQNYFRKICKVKEDELKHYLPILFF